MLAQRLLREDRAIGMFRLGLSKELADLLSALTQPAKNAEIAPTHAAILLAGQPAEQFA